MIRPIAALVAAFALFLSPILMAGSGAAMGHVPETQATAMDSHCSGMTPARDSGKSDQTKIDCAAACSALFATAPMIAPCIAMGAVRPAPGLPKRLGSLAAVQEPPPPRVSEKS